MPCYSSKLAYAHHVCYCTLLQHERGEGHHPHAPGGGEHHPLTLEQQQAADAERQAVAHQLPALMEALIHR